MTIPTTEEVPSSVRGPETATTSPWIGGRGLVAPRATTTRPTTAPRISVSHFCFDLGLST
jgi:hypothetical protein